MFLKDLAEKAVSKHTDDYRDGQTPEARQATLVSRWRRYITTAVHKTIADIIETQAIGAHCSSGRAIAIFDDRG